MGIHDFKYKKVPLFAGKKEYQYFDVCCPETSSLPASRYYCDVNWSYQNVCAKFQ